MPGAATFLCGKKVDNIYIKSEVLIKYNHFSINIKSPLNS
ncbi:hypothetical protein BP951000_0860 [Brachyspira pilosicoli 95/1000]|uniref:Uncharacterized protein n=1 Tax=Brachyspira pilosicoli (strain ATCC BAA-1826 / 95/1000) TaxID=759914 RepID=D8ICI5_BRAP9|nr:hypothetical protein BP951000_0860 [Brachyspira pilosicoli 95/1000]